MTSTGGVTVTDPRIGGGSGDKAWVRGSDVSVPQRSQPESTLARRPTDYKSAASIEARPST